MHQAKVLVAALVVASASAIAASAKAEVVVTPPPAPVVAERETIRPNRRLLAAGAITLVVGYTPALVVAIESDHKGDDKLYIPVVGPWLDMGQRGCDPGETNCGSSGIETAALITDGVVQGLGALQILGGLILPEQRTVVRAASSEPHLRVAPTSFGGRGYGLSAAGRF